MISNVENSWIQIDFRDYRHILTHHSVSFQNWLCLLFCSELSGWRFNGMEWNGEIQMDRRKNDCELRGLDCVQTFRINLEFGWFGFSKRAWTVMELILQPWNWLYLSVN
jgi:hypothetical protein